MGGTALTIFLLTSFLGGVTSGVAGFAMGLVVAGIYLHILTPIQTTALIVGYGFVTQGYGIWRLRHAMNWRRAAPFIVGCLIGVPVGTILLTYIDPDALRIGVGGLLMVYSIYGLARPSLKPVQGGAAVDTSVGVVNGMLAGLTGLGGLIIVIWCQLRNWPKDVQRGIFQPVLMTTILANTVSLTVSGAVTVETTKLYLLGLPCILAGTWVGMKLYGKLDDDKFRKVILLLLLASGVSLILPNSLFG